jgi:hypothetical protein
MTTELHTTVREMMICIEIILEFEALDTEQATAAQQIHHWASFLSNLCEKIHTMSEKNYNVMPYYLTMSTPLRRIINYTDLLLAEEYEPLTLNQEYSFQRIHRMATKAIALTHDMVTEIARSKPINGASSQSSR